MTEQATLAELKAIDPTLRDASITNDHFLALEVDEFKEAMGILEEEGVAPHLINFMGVLYRARQARLTGEPFKL